MRVWFSSRLFWNFSYFTIHHINLYSHSISQSVRMQLKNTTTWYCSPIVLHLKKKITFETACVWTPANGTDLATYGNKSTSHQHTTSTPPPVITFIRHNTHQEELNLAYYVLLLHLTCQLTETKPRIRTHFNRPLNRRVEHDLSPLSPYYELQ